MIRFLNEDWERPEIVDNVNLYINEHGQVRYSKYPVAAEESIVVSRQDAEWLKAAIAEKYPERKYRK